MNGNRRVRVGPRQSSEEAGKLAECAAGPVVEWLQGEFTYYSGSESCLKFSGKTVLLLSQALVGEVIEGLGRFPEHWLVGVDKKRRLIELRPTDDAKRPGALKASDAGRIRSKGLCSKTMVRWLRSVGIPDVQIPAHWQPQTGSIVGRYDAPEQKPA